MSSQAKSVRGSTETQAGAKKSRRDLKREAILIAGKELFFGEGYGGASIDAVVERVGGSKATFYSHFRSKDELLLAIVKQVTESAVADVFSVPANPDFREYLRKLGRVVLRWLTSPEIVALERIAAAEALRVPEVGKVFYEEGILPAYTGAAHIFQSAMDKGVLRQADPFVVLGHFVELCAGWRARLQIWNVAPAPTAREIGVHVDAAVEVFMDGYTSAR